MPKEFYNTKEYQDFTEFYNKNMDIFPEGMYINITNPVDFLDYFIIFYYRLSLKFNYSDFEGVDEMISFLEDLIALKIEFITVSIMVSIGEYSFDNNIQLFNYVVSKSNESLSGLMEKGRLNQ